MQGPAQSLGHGIWRLALRTPTLPPATATNTLVVMGEGLAVVEPATPFAEPRAQLDARISACMAQGASPRFVVITHHHADHIGSVDHLRERFGFEVCAHAETAARVRFAIDRELDEGDTLDLGAGVHMTVRHTPGHAPGHLVVDIPSANVSHVGDMVASEGTILIDPRDAGDMGAYLDSLRRLRDELQPGTRWVPAHGEVIDDPAALASYYIEHRLKREAKLLASLGAPGERVSLQTLLARTYDDKPASILPLAAGALEAHLQKLIAEGLVARDGAQLWRSEREAGAGQA